MSETQTYWQRWKRQYDADPLNTDRFWVQVKKDISRRNKPKHHLELYSYCKTDNPYIRQIKNSPNITIDTVAELICRDQACELQYCMSLQKLAVENRRANIDLQGCMAQFSTLSTCLQREKARIKQKEMELRQMVLQRQIDDVLEVPLAVSAGRSTPEIVETQTMKV